MKLIENRISCNFRAYAKDKEYVEYKGKRYIVTRPYDPVKVNTLTRRKQAIVKKLIKDGMSIKDISNIIGVPAKTIDSWWSMQCKQENYIHAQNYVRKGIGKKVKVICFTDNSIIVYDSVTAASESIGCSSSNVSNYCKSGNVYKHKSNGKEYKMDYIED